jgi:hypothetical protein
MPLPDDIADLIDQFGLVAWGCGRYVLGHVPQSENFSPEMQP